jgi:hypothetical protein
MPTPIHETIPFSFTSAIVQAEADLPLPVRCFCVTGEKTNGFEGQYLGSAKIPDLAVQTLNADHILETKMVVEVGFSEEYNDLISDVKLWLEGMSSVSLCMLISIVEKPYYKCPVKDKMDEEKFEKLGFPDPGELKPQHFYLEGRFGPVIYKGLDDELDDEEVGDEEPDDEEPDNEEVDDEEVDDEEVDNEEVGDEEPDDDEVDDKVDDKVGDEESSDEEPDIGELKWVGSISTAFLERWRRNARTGEAQKYGKRIVS